MNDKLHTHLVAVAVAGVFALPVLAYAGLGPIKVLSQPGEKFSAMIPIVDPVPGEAVVVSLADRNRYPLLAPYSASASRLHFEISHGLDGVPKAILVTGPARFTEPELDFAVAMRWAAGGEVREYQVDYRYVRLRHKPTPSPVTPDKKNLALHPLHGGMVNLGLGELKIKSLPGEPLMAEAELFGVSDAGQSQLRVRVSPYQPEKAGAEQIRFLSGMQYAVEKGVNGQRMLRLHSSEPLNAAPLGFRLDVSLGSAHLARHYALASGSKKVAVTEHALSGRIAPFKVVRVLPGDSLSRIAERLRHEGVSLRSAMQQLYRENPQAFIAGDANKLLAGAMLKYPDSWSAAAGTTSPATSPPAAAKTSPAVARPSSARPSADQQNPGLSLHAASPRGQAKVVIPAVPEAVHQPRTKVELSQALPEMPATQVARDQARMQALHQRLAEQERRLSDALTLSHSLERKLDDLRHEPSSMPGEVQAAGMHAPSVAPAGSGSWMPLAVGSGAAVLVAATTTALALRRRRLRLSAARQSVAMDTSPSIHGLRQLLLREPLNNDARYRLILLMVSNNDREGFLKEVELARLYFDPQGSLWQSVLQMGRDIAPDVALEPASATAVPAASVARPTAVATPAMKPMPERPLLDFGDFAELPQQQLVFQDVSGEALVKPDLPPPVDQQALAELYIEMGDSKTGHQLARPTR